MSIWNGQLITDMSTQHVASTISYLEKKARARCNGTDWKNFVDTIYFDLVAELERRENLYEKNIF